MDITWNALTPTLFTITGNDIVRNSTAGVGRAVSVETFNGDNTFQFNVNNGSVVNYSYIGLTSKTSPTILSNYEYLLRPGNSTAGRIAFIFENGSVVGASKYIDVDNWDENTM